MLTLGWKTLRKCENLLRILLQIKQNKACLLIELTRLSSKFRACWSQSLASLYFSLMTTVSFSVKQHEFHDLSPAKPREIWQFQFSLGEEGFSEQLRCSNNCLRENCITGIFNNYWTSMYGWDFSPSLAMSHIWLRRALRLKWQLQCPYRCLSTLPWCLLSPAAWSWWPWPPCSY